MGSNKYVYINEASKRIGVSIPTLRRWFLGGKVKDVARDRKNWRIFTDADIRRIREYANKITLPES
jgi:DNA (cytosine-5)-methyltransferase 1